MTELNCERCGPKGIPVAMVEVEGLDGKPYTVCLRCHAEDNRIAPTARKGEKPAPFVRGKVPSEWLGGGK